MKVAVCAECEEILAVGAFNDKIRPTHRSKGKIHVSTIFNVKDDPMAVDESATDYLKRLKKTYKDELFK